MRARGTDEFTARPSHSWSWYAGAARHEWSADDWPAALLLFDTCSSARPEVSKSSAGKGRRRASWRLSIDSADVAPTVDPDRFAGDEIRIEQEPYRFDDLVFTAPSA